MAINLPPNVLGVSIFLIVLIFLQFFLGVVGGIISNYIGLTGLYWWVITIGVVFIGDMILINVE